MSVRLEIAVGDVQRLLDLGYTHIEVWQEGSSYTYRELTSDSPKAAYVLSNEAKNVFRVGGRTLSFRVNGGAEVTVRFPTLVERWSAQQVADFINSNSPGTASVEGKRVRLVSPTTGRGSKIEITYDDTEDLGFIGQTERGQDARIPLVADRYVYVYEDLGGSPSAKYKWRFSASGIEPISEFSNWAHAVPGSLPGLQTTIGVARFANPDGSPARRTVIFAMEESQSLNGFVLGGEVPQTVQSDENGFLQIRLVRGAKLRVAIEGTPFIRIITVPNVDTFDLMQVLGSAPDPFTVQTIPPILNRRTLG